MHCFVHFAEIRLLFRRCQGGLDGGEPGEIVERFFREKIDIGPGQDRDDKIFPQEHQGEREIVIIIQDRQRQMFFVRCDEAVDYRVKIN